MATDDRRSRRSSLPGQALQMLLDACRAKGGYEAVVVADDHGFLVASSSGDASDRTIAENLLLPEFGELKGHVKRIPFRVSDSQLFVGALGMGSAAALVDAVFGCRRILA
jgi:hypothetical protein